MNPEKKIGICLIIIGMCISLFVLPFVSGYSKDKSAFSNFYDLAIEIADDDPVHSAEGSVGPQRSHQKAPDYSKIIPKRIPFRLFLAVTLVLLFIGFVRIDRSRERPDGDEEPADVTRNP